MRAGQIGRGPFTYKSPVESIFFTTVRIEAGDSIGTAFIVRHKWKKAGDNSLTLRDGESLDYGCFPTIIAPNTDTTPDIGLIEDVLFVGYPNGMFDKANNLPVARRGITATPATVDYGGRPVFLIDASVFPGSSGSPVFLYNVGGWRSTTAFVAGDRILFLARISHQVTAADADLTAFAALNAARDRAPPPHPAGSR